MFGCILSVSVVMSATPIVAVRPGSAPITMPTKLASAMMPSVAGSAKVAIERAKSARPSSIPLTGCWLE